MKRMFKTARKGLCALPIAALFAALLCSGCAIVKTSSEGGREMVAIENSCWYLLNCIPLASGNPEAPNERDFKFGVKTMTLDNNMRMLEAEMTRRGYTRYRDLVSYTADESYLVILLKRRSLYTSAELRP